MQQTAQGGLADMVAALPDNFPPLAASTLTLLDLISAASIDLLLKPIRAKAGRKGLPGTKPGTLLKKHIPIQAGIWM